MVSDGFLFFQEKDYVQIAKAHSATKAGYKGKLPMMARATDNGRYLTVLAMLIVTIAGTIMQSTVRQSRGRYIARFEDPAGIGEGLKGTYGRRLVEHHHRRNRLYTFQNYREDISIGISIKIDAFSSTICVCTKGVGRMIQRGVMYWG